MEGVYGSWFLCCLLTTVPYPPCYIGQKSSTLVWHKQYKSQRQACSIPAMGNRPRHVIILLTILIGMQRTLEKLLLTFEFPMLEMACFGHVLPLFWAPWIFSHKENWEEVNMCLEETIRLAAGKSIYYIPDHHGISHLKEAVRWHRLLFKPHNWQDLSFFSSSPVP